MNWQSLEGALLVLFSVVVGALSVGLAGRGRIRDLKYEVEFWRNQARQNEERERILAQENARLKGH